MTKTRIKEFRLGTSNTFLAAFDQNFIRLQEFPSLALTVRRIAGECYFDRVLLLQAKDIFSTLTNERGVVLIGNLENLGCFIGLNK
jgi:hypothetical protein